MIWETLLLVRSKEKEACLILGCNSKLQTLGNSLHLYQIFDMRTSRGCKKDNLRVTFSISQLRRNTVVILSVSDGRESCLNIF